MQYITARHTEIVKTVMRSNIEKICYGIIKYFKNKQRKMKALYCHGLDNDGSLRSVFRGDGRSRIAYFVFSVVQVFGVT